MGVVSWLHFPRDISICATRFPESHPLSSFHVLSFSGSEEEDLKRKYYLHTIPLSHLPFSNIFIGGGGESSKSSPILLTRRRNSLILIFTSPSPLPLLQSSPCLLPPGSSQYLLSKLSCDDCICPMIHCPHCNQSDLSKPAN